MSNLVDWGFSLTEVDLPSAPYSEKLKRRVVSLVRARRIWASRRLGTHTDEEWEALSASYGRCLRCNRSDLPLTKDHVVSVRDGGSDAIGNLQPLCQPCNSSKWMGSKDYRPTAR